MKIAVLADIHSNLPALLAVIKDLAREGAQEVLVLGDIVGYFAQPVECLDLLGSCGRPAHLVKGNHEDLLRDQCWQDEAENGMVLVGIRHADLVLSDEQYGFLRGLPRARFFTDWRVAVSHDTFTYPGNGKYVVYDGEADSEELCYMQLQALPVQFSIGFLGHTHIPYLYEKIPDKRRADFVEDLADREMPLLPEARYLINPGSVGQPRDNDSRTAYGLLDLDAKPATFRLRRLTYDIAATIEAIDDMRMAEGEVAEKLKRRLRGGW